MGLRVSKKRKNIENVGSIPVDRTDEVVVSANQFDQDEIKRLVKQLEDQPQLFILNQVLMLVNFYENFELEKKQWNRPSENLVPSPSNVCDVIFEPINNNLGYEPKHGPSKNICEPIFPKRIMATTDIIEVRENENVYTSIDKPSCQVKVKTAEHAGFVMLTTINGDKINFPPPQEQNIEPAAIPGPSSSDLDQEYDAITNLNTPKPLEIVDYSQRRNTLPETCFTIRSDRNFIDVESDEDDEDDDAYDQTDDDDEPRDKKMNLYIDVTYVNSAEFMNHFAGNIFAHNLGKTLGFTADDIRKAQPIPGKIFCTLSDTRFAHIPCQIIPTVPMQAPPILEFRNRPDRPTIHHMGQHFRWITENVVGKIEQSDCVLVPRGFYPKKGTNNDSCLEWEIAYPKAERILDTSLSRTKIRAMLFILLVHRTYIAPQTKNYGLLMEHVKTFMYWQYEANPKEWPEYALGQVVLELLKTFNNHLARSELCDFFNKKKNVFENIPSARLQYAHQVFHNVIQSPVIYFLDALRNLKVLNAKFYPLPDFKFIYHILTEKERVIETTKGPNFRKRKPRKSLGGSKEQQKEMAWQIRKEEATRKIVMERRRKQQEQKAYEESLKNERKESVSSINLESHVRKLTTLQTITLLTNFIRQFIDLAKHSRKLSSAKQGQFYLKQAFYLANVLQNYSQIESEEQLIEIRREEKHTQGLVESNNNDEPPSIPLRNSVAVDPKFIKRTSSGRILTPKNTVSFQL